MIKQAIKSGVTRVAGGFTPPSVVVKPGGKTHAGSTKFQGARTEGEHQGLMRSSPSLSSQLHSSFLMASSTAARMAHRWALPMQVMHYGGEEEADEDERVGLFGWWIMWTQASSDKSHEATVDLLQYSKNGLNPTAAR